jgi:hypothetical protein
MTASRVCVYDHWRSALCLTIHATGGGSNDHHGGRVPVRQAGIHRCLPSQELPEEQRLRVQRRGRRSQPGARVTGALKTYVGRGDSGQETRRRFCPECGSPIAVEVAIMPGIAMIEVRTLKPSMHIYCRSKLDWMVIPDGVGAFPEMLPAG